MLRGGWGIFYSNMITVGGMSSMEINPPNHLRIGLSTDRDVPSVFLKEGFAPDALTPQVRAQCHAGLAGSQPQGADGPAVEPQHPARASGGPRVGIGYTGNRLYNDWLSLDGNPAPPGAGTSIPRRFQTTAVPGTTDMITLANVVRIQKDGWIRYHASADSARKALLAGASRCWRRTRWSKLWGSVIPRAARTTFIRIR